MGASIIDAKKMWTGNLIKARLKERVSNRETARYLRKKGEVRGFCALNGSA